MSFKNRKQSINVGRGSEQDTNQDSPFLNGSIVSSAKKCTSRTAEPPSRADMQLQKFLLTFTRKT
jgi:hypothetical protein